MLNAGSPTLKHQPTTDLFNTKIIILITTHFIETIKKLTFTIRISQALASKEKFEKKIQEYLGFLLF